MTYRIPSARKREGAPKKEKKGSRSPVIEADNSFVASKEERGREEEGSEYQMWLSTLAQSREEREKGEGKAGKPSPLLKEGGEKGAATWSSRQ